MQVSRKYYLECSIAGIERVAIVSSQNVFTLALELVRSPVERDIVRVAVSRAGSSARVIRAFEHSLLAFTKSG